VYQQIKLFARRQPAYKRVRFVPGLIHYGVPEMICNRRARTVVVPSESLKRDLCALHNLSRDKVVVIPHGVEDRHLALYEGKKFDVAARAVFVGRLHYAKGIAAVVREFIRRADIAVTLTVVGDGPDRRDIEAIAAGDSRVQLIGSVDRDVLDVLLGNTNIFVFPTFYEGFGLALLEAMASGHACVAYDIPAVRELLDGAGLSVSPGDARALVDAVGALARAPQRIGDYAMRAHVRARVFSWPDAVERFDTLLIQTAGTSSRPRS
jgi:glycosyltransferase involved in cell wall biosynthesis